MKQIDTQQPREREKKKQGGRNSAASNFHGLAGSDGRDLQLRIQLRQARQLVTDGRK